jgi:hypothetical protein
MQKAAPSLPPRSCGRELTPGVPAGSELPSSWQVTHAILPSRSGKPLGIAIAGAIPTGWESDGLNRWHEMQSERSLWDGIPAASLPPAGTNCESGTPPARLPPAAKMANAPPRRTPRACRGRRVMGWEVPRNPWRSKSELISNGPRVWSRLIVTVAHSLEVGGEHRSRCREWRRQHSSRPRDDFQVIWRKNRVSSPPAGVGPNQRRWYATCTTKGVELRGWTERGCSRSDDGFPGSR